MSENVSVFRALNAVSEGGLHHKSAVVRGEVARILDLVVAQMGAERVSHEKRFIGFFKRVHARKIVEATLLRCNKIVVLENASPIRYCHR